MISENKTVVFPDELLANKVIETTIFTEENDTFGIALLSESDGDTPLILHIYQLVWDYSKEAFTPIQELEAFRFPNRDSLEDFVYRLPDMSGLEMLMLLNPVGGVH